MGLLDGSIGLSTLALLFICLAIALGFEFVNGFHDTANAVATVIYTRSLKPWKAVLWSGCMNFLGVLFGGVAVAFSIVHLLPVDLLINIGKTAGLLMVLSLLLSAIIWNFGTWYFGLPSSSSHALIGSILGVGLASSLFSGQGFGSGVNWMKAREVALSLLISPLIGFCLAGGLLLLSKAFIRDHRLYNEPKGGEPPPFWIRSILLLTCTGVSFAHGSNDGQKGVGLIMLILIGILPSHYAVNGSLDLAQIKRTVAQVQQIDGLVGRYAMSEGAATLQQELRNIGATLSSTRRLTDLSAQERSALRASILDVDARLREFETTQGATLSMQDQAILRAGRAHLRRVVDFVVTWVVFAVALALGIGTTVGWKRIVVTVGERIGKTHLTYAQGASAELITMSTIAGADLFGLPVSTTHVLSSGVAGTMAANQSGLQLKTIRAIALAWLLTLPVTMLLSGSLFSITARSSMKEITKHVVVRPHQERVLRKLE